MNEACSYFIYALICAIGIVLIVCSFRGRGTGTGSDNSGTGTDKQRTERDIAAARDNNTESERLNRQLGEGCDRAGTLIQRAKEILGL